VRPGGLVLAGLLAIAGGCASPTPTPMPLERASLSPTLLFNRDPGLPPAERFAVRSDWPSVRSAQMGTERVLYRERFIDWQGPGAWGRDSSYRRTETYRIGHGER
jgi:hypothetical protein